MEEVFNCHMACAETVQGLNQGRLLDNLLHRYNRLERPVHDASQTLTVGLGLSLMQIIDVVRRYCISTLWAGFGIFALDRPSLAHQGRQMLISCFQLICWSWFFIFFIG